MPLPANGPLTLIGRILNPDGSGVNGFLAFQLNTYGSVQPNAGGPKAILPNDLVRVQFVDGDVQGTPQIYGNDNLAGATYYIVQFFQAGNNNPVFTENWYISGAGPNFDVGGVQPIQVADLPAYLSLSQILGTTGIITGLHGDVSAEGFGDVEATLIETGVVSDTYLAADITCDAKGRILDIASHTFTWSDFDDAGTIPSTLLPVATSGAIGGIKPGDGFEVDSDGTLSFSGASGVAPFTLTTVGVSGAAALDGTVLNIPRYDEAVAAGAASYGISGLGEWRLDGFGNLECWGQVQLPTGGNQVNTNGTFPKAFSAVPKVQVTAQNLPSTAADPPIVQCSSTSTTGFTVHGMTAVPEGGGGVVFSTNVTVAYHAIGRA